MVPFSLALPAILALALPAPRVFVDTSAVTGSEVSEVEARRLDGALRVRLLEEGYVIAPQPEAGVLRLEVRPFEGGWMVLARGERTTSYALPKGALALRSLELLQRAVLALEATGAPATRGDDSETISVSVAVITESDASLGSRAQALMVQALATAGVAVAPVTRSSDAVVCLRFATDTFSLGSGSDAAKCQAGAAAQPREGRSDREILQLVERRTASLAIDALALRAAARAMPDPDSNPSASSNPNPNPNPSAKPNPNPKPDLASRLARNTELAFSDDERHEATSTQLELAVSGGVLARSGGTDPLLRAHFDVWRSSGWGVRVEPAVSWSSVPALGIVETSLKAGVVWTRPLGRASTFTLGLLGGVVLHHFDYSERDQGTRINWACALPAELSRRVGSFSLTLGLSPGLMGPARDHEVFERRVWHRGPLALAATAGVGLLL